MERPAFLQVRGNHLSAPSEEWEEPGKESGDILGPSCPSAVSGTFQGVAPSSDLGSWPCVGVDYELDAVLVIRWGNKGRRRASWQEGITHSSAAPYDILQLLQDLGRNEVSL